jgi:hypothetical protein
MGFHEVPWNSMRFYDVLVNRSVPTEANRGLTSYSKVLISTWFELGIPRDWVIQVSPNGWTSNDLRFAWLKHFNLHAKPVGVYRMLIIDGHKSHCSLEFQDYCKENKIITLCMLSHSLHLLQPLDVTCFAPLKRSYGNGISALARNHIHHCDGLGP